MAVRNTINSHTMYNGAVCTS